MKKILSFVVILSIFLFSSSDNACCQEKIEFLRSGEHGDIVILHAALEKYDSSMIRGEYETKDEYNKRIEQLIKVNMQPFKIELPFYRHYFKYDIDNERYIFNGYSVHDKMLTIKVYENFNPEISFLKKENIHIRIYNIKHKYIKNYGLSCNIAVPAKIAKSVKDNFFVVAELMAHKTKDGYVSRNDNTSEGEEINGNVDDCYIHVKLLAIYLVSKENGIPLGKVVF